MINVGPLDRVLRIVIGLVLIAIRSSMKSTWRWPALRARVSIELEGSECGFSVLTLALWQHIMSSLRAASSDESRRGLLANQEKSPPALERPPARMRQVASFGRWSPCPRVVLERVTREVALRRWHAHTNAAPFAWSSALAG